MMDKVNDRGEDVWKTGEVKGEGEEDLAALASRRPSSTSACREMRSGFPQRAS